jgi:hypothetical protein
MTTASLVNHMGLRPPVAEAVARIHEDAMSSQHAAASAERKYRQCAKAQVAARHQPLQR